MNSPADAQTVAERAELRLEQYLIHLRKCPDDATTKQKVATLERAISELRCLNGVGNAEVLFQH